MPTMTKYAAGTFCWPELGTTDPDKAKKFYAALFNWKLNDLPIPDGTYTMIQRGGKDVGALYKLMEEQLKQEVPPHWLSYIAVESVDKTLEKIKANQGKVLMGPMDVKPDGKTLIGRMAVVQDPQGAVFALWQSGTHSGAGLVNEPGSLTWNELWTTDQAAAKKFYTAVFGWGSQEMPMPSGTYNIVKVGDNMNGGIMAIPKEMGPVPPNWLVYFAVDDCDKRAEKAKSLGGKITVPPTDIPNVGRFAIVQDPQGAVFAILKLASA